MKRVLVFGDAIADEYVNCFRKKMCPEAPEAPALVEMNRRLIPGGAANVAVNLAALSPDVSVDLIAVIDDDLAREIKQISKNRVSMEFCVFEPPVRKTRYLEGGRIIVRIDDQLQVNRFASESLGARLNEYLSSHLPDLILLSDYGLGCLGMSLERLLDFKERLIIDTKIIDLSCFSGTLGCKLNHSEWADSISIESSPERNFGFMVVTLGGNGAKIYMHREDGAREITHSMTFPGHDVKVKDTNGCGDSFLAGFAASFVRNRDPFTATSFGNAAGADVVQKMGTAVVDLDSVLGLLGMVEDEVGTGSTRADHRDTAPWAV